MLIQITNRCHMNCPHCLQNSNPRGKHMTEETFERVLDFCREARPMVVNITGGEPTEHPHWAHIVQSIYNLPSVKALAVITNGAWIENDKDRLAMARLIRNAKGAIKVQVYSNPDYYKNHEWTVAHKARYKSIGCITDFTSPIFMQDLGRARKNCQVEVEGSDHVPSCINSHLIALQARSLPHFLTMAVQAGKFCRPIIDPDGNIHMSESWLCPAVASVNDGVSVAFDKMRRSRPCKGCKLYRNFERLHPREMEIFKTNHIS